MRGHDFELRIGAVRGLFVRTPSAKSRHVPEAAALHVLVGNFDDKLGAERLPGKILALAPAALASGHPMFAIARSRLGPAFPGMIRKSVFSIWREEIYEFAPHVIFKASADADVLKGTGIVIQSEQ